MQSPGAATELAFRAWRSLPRRREAPGLLSVSVSSFQAFRLLLITRTEGLLECRPFVGLTQAFIAPCAGPFFGSFSGHGEIAFRRI